jgi:hypothetical protein
MQFGLTPRPHSRFSHNEDTSFAVAACAEIGAGLRSITAVERERRASVFCYGRNREEN